MKFINMKYLYDPTIGNTNNLIKGEIYCAEMSPKNVLFLYTNDILKEENYHTDCYGNFSYGKCANGCKIRIPTLEEKETFLKILEAKGLYEKTYNYELY